MELPVICDRCLKHVHAEHVSGDDSSDILYLISCHGETRMVVVWPIRYPGHKRTAYLWSDLPDAYLKPEAEIENLQDTIDQCRRKIEMLKRVTKTSC